PHAGQVVGLEFQPDGGTVHLRLAERPPAALGAGAVTEQALDVVADLVGDHVGPRELAWGVQLALHVAVEGQVDVHPAVAGAVERPDRGAGHAAGRLDLPAEQDEDGLLVAAAHAAEEFVPDDLRVVEDDLGEMGLLLLLGIDRPLVALHRRRVRRAGADEAGELSGVNAEEQRQQQDQQPAAAEGNPGPRREAAAVLDVLTLFTVFPFHGTPPRWAGSRASVRSDVRLQKPRRNTPTVWRRTGGVSRLGSPAGGLTPAVRRRLAAKRFLPSFPRPRRCGTAPGCRALAA